MLSSWLQIGTNNCTARYRTLSGGIGGSPSPTHSSDYVNDDDDDDDDGINASINNQSIHNGMTNSSTNSTIATNASTATTNNNNNKPKRNNLSSNLHKASAISHQKATVHVHVSLNF